MKIAISEQVLEQELDDEVILLDLQSGRYFGLQEVGARAWRLACECTDTAMVLDRLLEEYAVDPAALSQDMDALWQTLLDASLITVVADQ